MKSSKKNTWLMRRTQTIFMSRLPLTLTGFKSSTLAVPAPRGAGDVRHVGGLLPEQGGSIDVRGHGVRAHDHRIGRLEVRSEPPVGPFVIIVIVPSRMTSVGRTRSASSLTMLLMSWWKTFRRPPSRPYQFFMIRLAPAR